MLDGKTKNRVLKAYLGMYAVTASQDEIEMFRAIMPELTSVYVQASPEMLKKFGAYVLLEWGRQEYTANFAYDIVEDFLHSDEGFYNVHCKLNIIYHPRKTMPNKQLQNMVNHTVMLRKNSRKPTIVLCEEHLNEVREAMTELRLIPLAKSKPATPKPGALQVFDEDDGEIF